MIDLFTDNEITPGAEWVFYEPAVVHRLHDVTMELELKKRFKFFKQWYFEYEGQWDTCSPRLFPALKRALSQPPYDSNVETYTPQKYYLVDVRGWRLVPDRDAVQLGNFQNLELHLVGDPTEAYDEIKEVLTEVFSYVDEEAVVFKSTDFTKRVRLLKKDFL